MIRTISLRSTSRESETCCWEPPPCSSTQASTWWVRVTEAGQLVTASASGSQLGPYASGAGRLILVIGSKKLVPDLEAALDRIRDHVQP